MARRSGARGRRKIKSRRLRSRQKRPSPKIRRTFLHNLTRLTATAKTRQQCTDTRHAIIAHHERGDITDATRLRLLSQLERKRLRN